jgi:hypothetical protein
LSAEEVDALYEELKARGARVLNARLCFGMSTGEAY